MTVKPHVERPQTGGGGVGLEPQAAETVSRRSDRPELVDLRSRGGTAGAECASPDPLQSTDRYRLVTPYTLRL